MEASECAQLRSDARPTAASTIGVFAEPALPGEVVERALGAWSRCFAVDSGLPRFEVGLPGTRDLFVRYDPAAIGPDATCGTFRGRTITLYGRARSPGGRVRSCGSLAQNLIHEMGHALGLADAPRSCGSFAMAKLSSGNLFHRRVQRAECRVLQERWLLLGEALDPVTRAAPPLGLEP